MGHMYHNSTFTHFHTSTFNPQCAAYRTPSWRVDEGSGTQMCHGMPECIITVENEFSEIKVIVFMRAFSLRVGSEITWILFKILNPPHFLFNVTFKLTCALCHNYISVLKQCKSRKSFKIRPCDRSKQHFDGRCFAYCIFKNIQTTFAVYTTMQTCRHPANETVVW